MYRIDNISLVSFRNYEQATFSFPRAVTGFCGNNGTGKTNLLDAIYYLCFTKSYFGKTDGQNPTHGKAGFRIDGQFTLKDQVYNAIAVLRENGKKEFGVNNEQYSRFAAHIGRFPCVVIAPDDTVIITEGSEERRKFMDYTISQLSSSYLQTLIDYNKLLQQRNSMLKKWAETQTMDESLMEIISGQLVAAGNAIFQKRKAFLDEFTPIAVALYHFISDGKEKLELRYQSHLTSASFAGLLKASRSKDMALQRTTSGIHRDDLECRMNGELFKATASQGQRKSLLFALKLAEFEMLLRHNQFPPILLLDDVFEKLDEHRMKQLLYKVGVENKGQVFITDTHCARLEEALHTLSIDHTIINLQ